MMSTTPHCPAVFVKLDRLCRVAPAAAENVICPAPSWIAVTVHSRVVMLFGNVTVIAEPLVKWTVFPQSDAANVSVVPETIRPPPTTVLLNVSVPECVLLPDVVLFPSSSGIVFPLVPVTFPPSEDALRLATLVVLVTVSGAVPVETVETSCDPVTTPAATVAVDELQPPEPLSTRIWLAEPDVEHPPPPPDAAIVMVPLPLVIVTLAPCVSVALLMPPVAVLPMSSWPSVYDVWPVPPFPKASVPVTPVVRGSPVRFVATPAEGVPRSPPWKYSSNEPVSSVIAVRRLAEDGVASHVATPLPRPVNDPTGSAVPFDRLIEAGVCIASPLGRVVLIGGTPDPFVTSTPLFAVAKLPSTPALSYSRPLSVPLAMVEDPTSRATGAGARPVTTTPKTIMLSELT